MPQKPNSRKKKAEREWEPLANGVEIFRWSDDDPVRDVLNGRRTLVVCAHYSYKVLRHVPCEGQGEERSARTLDCVSPAIEYFGQPETIRFELDASFGRETYTPDFKVLFRNGFARVEYKRVQDLWPPVPTDSKDEYAIYHWNRTEEMRAKLRRAREAYRRAGLAWILLTDVSLAKFSDPAVVNEVIANSGCPIADDDLGRLRHELSNRPLPLGRCEDIIRESSFARGPLLSLIPSNIVGINLRRTIDADTIVHPVQGSYQKAA
jgi:hypothetical protein